MRDEAIGQKIWKPQYHLNPHKRLVYIYNTMKNVESGLYEPGDSLLYNVPVIIIPKKDGRERLAYDLTKLNANTKDQQSYIPSYNWLFELLRGRGLFTVSDIKNFFENIFIRKSDREYCTITSPLGRYRLTRATYGFKNIATIAQEISNAIMQPMGKAGAFIDDLFIKHEPGATDDQLLAKTEKFLNKVQEVGVLLHPEKTFFFVSEIEFLGYVFTAEGTKPQAKYIKKILDIKKPTTASEIRAYLGVIQYIARYVHELAEWSYWLAILTRKDNKRKWGPDQDAAFEQLQTRIRNIKLLSHPTDNDPYLVQCDASQHAIGAVLYQYQYDKKLKRKQWKIIEFYSKQVDSQLIKHPIMVKECLAIAYSLNHWKHFLLRRKFYLDTDHKNLIRMFDDDETKAPAMRKKQIMVTLRQVTSMFHFQLKHLAGKDIILADYLSRDGSVLNQCEPSKIKLLSPVIDDPIDKIRFETVKSLLKQPIEVVQSPSWTPLRNWCTSIAQRVNLMAADEVDTASVSPTISLKQFSIQQLNREYIKHFAYVQPIKSLSWASGDLPPNAHTPLEAAEFELNQSFRPCLKNRQRFTSTSKDTKQTSTYRASLAADEIYRNNSTEFDRFLQSNLLKAAKNTFKNLNEHPSSAHLADTIYSLGKLIENYSLMPVSQPDEITFKQPIAKNYSTNSSGLRRSTRNKKPYTPFWKRTQIASDNAHANQPTSVPTDSASDSDSNSESDFFDEPYIHSQVPQARYRLTYPYMVHQPLADNLYEAIYRPREFEQVLSHQNLIFEQKNDVICQYIHDMTRCSSVQNRTRASDKLKATYPKIWNLANRDQFEWNDGLIYLKPNKRYPHARLVIPLKLIRPILKYEHTIQHKDHPGANAMINLLRTKYYWFLMHEDIRHFTQRCPECQAGKGSKSYKRGGLQPLRSHEHGEIVHIDGAGPFFKRIKIGVIVDNYTGATVFFPCDSESAENMVFGLIHHWIPYHGVPKKVVTDRGKGFIAHANRIVYKMLGIHKLFTSSYHPQSNAKAERRVQELKKAYRMINIELDEKYTKYNPDDVRLQQQLAKELVLLLPSIQFAINQKLHSVTQVSPHMMLYGKNLRDIVDFKLAKATLDEIENDNLFSQSKHEIIKLLKAQLKLAQTTHDTNYDKYVIIMKRNYDSNKHQDAFEVGDLVAYYIGDRASTNIKLQRRFSGPWRIMRRVKHNTTQIKNIETGETFACHVAMLKRYYASEFVPLLELEATERAKAQAAERQLRSKRKRKRKSLKKPKEDVQPTNSS